MITKLTLYNGLKENKNYVFLVDTFCSLNNVGAMPIIAIWDTCTNFCFFLEEMRFWRDHDSLYKEKAAAFSIAKYQTAASKQQLAN